MRKLFFLLLFFCGIVQAGLIVAGHEISAAMEKNVPGYKNLFRHEWIIPVLPEHKYRLSVEVASDNPEATSAHGNRVFLTDAKQAQNDSLVQFYPWNKNSHPFQNYTETFYTSPDSRFLKIYFFCSGARHKLLLRNMRLEELPTPATALERERDALTSSWYQPLPWIERAVEVPTPHRAWQLDSCTDILYLPYIKGSYGDTARRRMFETAQRMQIKYRTIPLLGKVAKVQGCGIMGVYGSVLKPGVERYSLLQLQNADAPVIVWQDFDFKKNCTPEIDAFLKKAVENKRGLVFIDCFNIPDFALGTPDLEAVSRELTFLPCRSEVPPKKRKIALFRRGNAWSLTYSFFYRNNQYNPLIPANEAGTREPSLGSWDYPYNEYNELLFVRLLRKVSQKETAVRIKSLKAEAEKVVVEVTGEEKELQVEVVFRPAGWLNPITQYAQVRQHQAEFPLDNLPEGTYAAEIRLLRGKLVPDAGAVLVTVPASSAKLVVPQGKKHGEKLLFSADPGKNGASFTLHIFDTNFREVFRAHRSGKAELLFAPPPPLSTLYMAQLDVFDANGKLTGTRYKEFSVAGKPLDSAQLHFFCWSESDSFKYHRLCQLGADGFITFQNNFDALRTMRLLNCEPLIMGLANVAWGMDSKCWVPYKSDREGPKIRKPCFSDPAAQSRAIYNMERMTAKPLCAYYDTKFQLLGDELFCGRNCCICPHCMKEFRKMHPDAKTDDCLPGGKYFIDHRIFMNRVFADKMNGILIQSLQKTFPQLHVGLSGTYSPGSSYNWRMLMRKMDFICYYAGLQRKLAHDFGRAGLFSGTWQGGYTYPVAKDWYVNRNFWSHFLSGSNVVPAYLPHSALSGDLAVTPLLQTLLDNIREVRGGLDRLILRSKESREVALLFSQRSLFTAGYDAESSRYQNTLTGWEKVLGDLAIPFKLIDDSDFTGKEKFKVLIVPDGSALSLEMWRKIRAFSGVVITDGTPALFDEKGNKRTGEEQKKLLAGFHSMPERCAIYSIVSYGGIGGEVVKESSGDAALCSALKNKVEKLFADAGITPFAWLKGSRENVEFFQRNYHGIPLIGVVDRRTGNTLDASEQIMVKTPAEKAELQLNTGGLLFNLRTRKYIGKGKTIPVDLKPGFAGVWAVLPEKLPPFQAELPKRIEQGKPLVCRVQTKHLPRIIGCEYSGSGMTYRTSVEILSENAEIQLPNPWNCHGKMKLVLRDMLSEQQECLTLKISGKAPDGRRSE